MTTQPQTLELIPLNRLQPSPVNVRRRDRKVDLEALAASIQVHGLLQNLAVADAGDGNYAVVAGGRRLAALKALAKAGTIARDFPVPCRIVAGEESREASLTENVHRIAMDPLDEADAFAGVLAEGKTVEDIARRFGATRRHVDQRLALAKLSPKLKAAWKRGDLTLDAARAFCLVDDHKRQDAVFRSLAKPVCHPASVRSRLMEGGMRASDRFAVFVGLDAYEAAGGKLVRDLFDAEAVFVEDPALMLSLADHALAAHACDWKSRGWGWVEASLDGRPAQPLSPMRIHPQWRDPTAEEQADLDRLEGELGTLDAELDESSTEDDPRWTKRDDLEAAYETIRQAARVWDPALMALTGVMLTIGHDGAVVATEGLVRKDDQKKVEAARRGETDASETQDGPEDAVVRVPGLPRSVARDLTRARSEAIRAGVGEQPDIALAICVAALASCAHAGADLPGIGLRLRVARTEAIAEGEDAAARLFAVDDVVGRALSLDRETLLQALAALVATAIDLAHENATPQDQCLQATADAVAQALDLDMTRHWRADDTFWTRLPKAILLDILADCPAASALPERKRPAFLAANAKLKKDALAARLADAFKDGAYLPDLLVTPLAAGQLEVLDPGAIMVAAE